MASMKWIKPAARSSSPQPIHHSSSVAWGPRNVRYSHKHADAQLLRKIGWKQDPNSVLFVFKEQSEANKRVQSCADKCRIRAFVPNHLDFQKLQTEMTLVKQQKNKTGIYGFIYFKILWLQGPLLMVKRRESEAEREGEEMQWKSLYVIDIFLCEYLYLYGNTTFCW